MPVAALSKNKLRRKAATRRAPKPAFRFPVGHPFAGIEDAFGSINIPVPPAPKRKAVIRGRILADHNT